MRKLISLLIVIVMSFSQVVQGADVTAPFKYKWRNLPIGAGGFVTGIIFHPSEPDLMYLRTDVGGAYRWDQDAQSWLPLCDMFGTEYENLYGIDGLAIDPKDPDVVYIAAGKYAWDNSICDVLKSTDRGKTWSRTNLNTYFNANGANRGLGECIAVDPANSSVIYCGTFKQGLYRSTTGGQTWAKISGIETTNPIRNVVFANDTPGSDRSQTIYVGVVNEGVYRSTDGGTTWAKIPNTPVKVNRMEVGESGSLYVAASNGLWKLTGDSWSNISPNAASKPAHGISISAENEAVMVCVVDEGDQMKRPFYYSEDGGLSWVNKRLSAKFTTTVPWDAKPNFSSNTSDIKINPHNTEQVFFTDWFGVYATNDITEVDEQSWTNPVAGIEEIVPLTAICPPTGKYRLITGVADCDGQVYENLDEYPKRRLTNEPRPVPWMMSTIQIDFCEQNPDFMVRAGVDYNIAGRVEVSQNGSESWANVTPSGADQGLRIAVSSSINPATGYPSMVLIQLNKAPLYSLDFGTSWNQVEGIPDTQLVTDRWNRNIPLASDRVNGNKFYIRDSNGDIYESADWGKSWTKKAQITGSGNTIVKTAPGIENDLWVGVRKSWTSDSNGGLYRSTDGGTSFSKLENVTDVIGYGFGKEAPGHNNPALYLFGTVNGREAMYRSLDMGDTWDMINDQDSKLGNAPNIVEGDRQNFGVVYVGTDGRGIYYGTPEAIAENNAKLNYYKETFEYYDADVKDSFDGYNGWSVAYKNKAGAPTTNANTYTMVTQDPDTTVDNNKVGLLYDAHSGNDNNANINARLDFKKLTGDNSDKIITLQFKWLQKADNKWTLISLQDGDKRIASLTCPTVVNGGLTLRMPSSEPGGAVDADNVSHLMWGYDQKWHTVKLELNFKHKSIDAYFDGNWKRSGYFVTADVEGIDSILINSANDSDSFVYLDDIYIVEGTDINIANMEYDVIDGSASYSVEHGMAAVTAKIFKGNGDAVVLAAAYDAQGSVIGLADITEIDSTTILYSGAANYQTSFAVQNDNVKTLKLFVFSSLSNLKPLCDFAICKLVSQ